MTVNPTRNNSEIDPDEPAPESDTLAADWQQVLDNRGEWAPDNPPMIADRFWRGIVPVQTTPSDRVAYFTYAPVTGTDNPFRLVGRQQEGIACRIRIQNVGTGGNDAAIGEGGSSFASTFVAGRTFYPNAWLLPGAATPLAPITIETKDEVWIAPVIGTPVVCVMVETFDLTS